MDLNRMAVYTGLPVKERNALRQAAYRQDGPVDIKIHEDYLAEVWYDNVDYEVGLSYCQNGGKFAAGLCSSIARGNFLAHSYDWTYDDASTFIVHTKARGSKYASVGAAQIAGLKKDFIKTKKLNQWYKALPSMMLDGINEYGVGASINVVPAEKSTERVIPTEETLDYIGDIMIVRYILDNFQTAAAAVDFISKHVEIIMTKYLIDNDELIHCLVTDAFGDAYIIEFAYNKVQIIKPDISAMTNFYLFETVLNSDNTVYTPATQDATHGAMKTNKITERGMGLERFNIIAADYDSIDSVAKMRALLDKLKYTRCYPSSPIAADPAWLTEAVGFRGLTVESTPQEYAPVVEIMDGYYKNRERGDGLTWQTVHASVYDIRNRKLYIRVQEKDTDYEFTI